MAPRRSKFNVNLDDPSDRTFEGIVFDSAAEMRMYRDWLLPKQQNGEIRIIERQKTFVLMDGFKHKGKKILPILYVADFVVTYADDTVRIFDYKGQADSISKMKYKMFLARYGPDLEVEWITYSKIDGGFVDYHTVQKNRRERKKLKEKANADSV